MRALYTAATGMRAQQLRIDTIANNIANVNTEGFKKSSARFEDLYYQKVRTGTGLTAAGTGRNDVVEVGHGARATQVARDFRTGTFTQTGRTTDLFVDGDGFFAVDTPDGQQLYTRLGNFAVDADGNLVTPDGMPLSDSIVVPADGELAIGEDGVVTVTVDGESSQIGQIALHRFRNPQGLEALGGGLYRATVASGAAETGSPGVGGFGSVLSGGLEGSNVDVAEELIAMILAQRSYELAGKVVETADEMMQATNQVK